MKKKIQRQFTEAEKAYFKKHRKVVLIRSILLIGFLFAFNIFAWFIYISQVSMTIDMKVISWDVIFSSNGSVVREIQINTDIVPGMEQYTYTVNIQNSSEVSANIAFDTKSLLLFGQEVLTSGLTETQKRSFLTNDVPFKIGYTLGTVQLSDLASTTFVISINWPYEEAQYYKVLSTFAYDDELTYYSYNNNTYSIATVDVSTYPSLKNNLYLTKDDFDSYLGYKCSEYYNNTGNSCLTLVGELSATQSTP